MCMTPALLAILFRKMLWTVLGGLLMDKHLGHHWTAEIGSWQASWGFQRPVILIWVTVVVDGWPQRASGMQEVLMQASLPAWDDATISGADASISKITARLEHNSCIHASSIVVVFNPLLRPVGRSAQIKACLLEEKNPLEYCCVEVETWHHHICSHDDVSDDEWLFFSYWQERERRGRLTHPPWCSCLIVNALMYPFESC